MELTGGVAVDVTVKHATHLRCGLLRSSVRLNLLRQRRQQHPHSFELNRRRDLLNRSRSSPGERLTAETSPSSPVLEENRGRNPQKRFAGRSLRRTAPAREYLICIGGNTCPPLVQCAAATGTNAPALTSVSLANFSQVILFAVAWVRCIGLSSAIFMFESVFGVGRAPRVALRCASITFGFAALSSLVESGRGVCPPRGPWKTRTR